MERYFVLIKFKTENSSFLSNALVCLPHQSHPSHQPLALRIQSSLVTYLSLQCCVSLLNSCSLACVAVWFPSSLEATCCHGNALRMSSSMFMSDEFPLLFRVPSGRVQPPRRSRRSGSRCSSGCGFLREGSENEFLFLLKLS